MAAFERAGHQRDAASTTSWKSKAWSFISPCSICRLYFRVLNKNAVLGIVGLVKTVLFFNWIGFIHELERALRPLAGDP